MPALDKKIQQALELKQPLFWEQRVGGTAEVQLVAVTYTWENGRQRTKKLASYDVRFELEKFVALHKKYAGQIYGFDGVVKNFRWNGLVDKSPDQLLQEAEDASTNS